MSNKTVTTSPPQHLKLVENDDTTPPLAAPGPKTEAPPDPANGHAQAVAADLSTFVNSGTLQLIFAVGVGSDGKFFRNIGGSGNAYELLGFIEIQKQELVNVITASQKEDPSGGASSNVAPGTTSGNEVPQDPPAISK